MAGTDDAAAGSLASDELTTSMGAALVALAAGAAEAEAAVAAAEEQASAVEAQEPAQQLQVNDETVACGKALEAEGQVAQEAPQAQGQDAQDAQGQEAQEQEGQQQQQQPGSTESTAAALGHQQQPPDGVGLDTSDVEGVEASGGGAPAAIVGEFAAVADSSSAPQSVEMLPSPEPPEHSGGDGCSARRGGDGGECGEGSGAGVTSAIACDVGKCDGAGHEGMGLEGDAAEGVTPVATEWSSGSEGGSHRQAAGEDSPSLG